MEVISERISVLRKDDVISIVILPSRNRMKLFLLFLWLFAWTVCGVIVAANYFNVTEKDARLFIIVYLAFWMYFEVMIIKAYVWKRFGREKVWMTSGKLHYQKETYGKGKQKVYLAEMMSPFAVVPIREGNFFDQLSQSFFMTGGPRVEFTIQGRLVRFGLQLTDAEAATVVKALNKFRKTPGQP